MGRKALAKLMDCAFPTTLRQLQALMGRLNFVGKFVPDFKRWIKPLVLLLGSKGEMVWRVEHTIILNSIIDQVFHRMKLGLVDLHKELRIHVDADEYNCSAVIVQDTREDHSIALMMGRSFTVTKAKCSMIDRILICAA